MEYLGLVDSHWFGALRGDDKSPEDGGIIPRINTGCHVARLHHSQRAMDLWMRCHFYLDFGVIGGAFH